MSHAQALTQAILGGDKPAPVGRTVTQYPAVGDTLQVLHASELDAAEVAHIRRSGSEQRVVAAVLMSDSHGYNVRDSAGDVWTVKRGSKCDWETIYVRYV